MNELEQIISIMEQFQKEQQQMKNDINNLYNTVKNSLIMQKNSTTDMNERVLPALKLMIDGLGNNLKYEIADYITHNNHLFFPKIESHKTTINNIINEGKSLARFGDGEFSIIYGTNRWSFQQYDGQLSERLLQVLQSDNDKLMIAIADNYGDLSKYTSESKSEIRAYMTDETRKKHETLLNKNKTYHDAYITRWYMMMNDKKTEAPANRLSNLKKIWNNKNVIAVEGEFTRLGVGNNLFDNAASFKRIIAPGTNSFRKYDDILDACLKYGSKNDLFLLAIGPSSGVLAYDLVQNDYQAVDVGHIDLEYMWYLAGAENRTSIPSRYNNEVDPDVIPEPVQDNSYYEQIIWKYTD